MRGRGLTIRLFQLGIPLGTIESLFITHFHSDHLNGLPDYFLTSYLRTPYAVRNKEMRLAGPTGIKRISEAMREVQRDLSRHEALLRIERATDVYVAYVQLVRKTRQVAGGYIKEAHYRETGEWIGEEAPHGPLEDEAAA